MKITSKQNFEGHIEEIMEEQEGEFLKEGEKTLLVLKDRRIRITKSCVIQEQETCKMIIELEKIHNCSYKTPYGNIEMKVKGLEIDYIEKEILEAGETRILRLVYEVQLGRSKPYRNELMIDINNK